MRVHGTVIRRVQVSSSLGGVVLLILAVQSGLTSVILSIGHVADRAPAVGGGVVSGGSMAVSVGGTSVSTRGLVVSMNVVGPLLRLVGSMGGRMSTLFRGRDMLQVHREGMRMSSSGQAVIVAFGLMSGSHAGVVGSLGRMVCSVGRVADASMRISSMSMGSGSVGMRIGSMLMLCLCDSMARRGINVTVRKTATNVRTGRVDVLHLQNVARHAMRRVRRVVRRHRNARPKPRMSRVGDWSHHHVMPMGVWSSHTAHHNVRVVSLTASAELLNRLRVDDITIAEGNRHSLHLIEDGGDAQACQTKIIMAHNE